MDERQAPGQAYAAAEGTGETIPQSASLTAPFTQGSQGETDSHSQCAHWLRGDRPEACAPAGAEERVEQLKRLSGILIDRLEQAVEAKDFSVKELRSYTNTLMDLRQIQMTDPELIATEQELRLIKLRREAGELAPRQLRISFEGETAAASE